jgi:dCMP deaminase
MAKYIQAICFNCDPRHWKPGQTVEITREGFCPSCGRYIMDLKENYYKETLKRWDTYFHKLCVSVASKSPCMSRRIGAILVQDNILVSTGYNGPPRGYPHCLSCPRKAEGYNSGEGLHICPATHAEANCIASAARLGVSVKGSTLYMNCIVPCKDCMSLLINAGISEIVIDKIEPYHEMSLKMAQIANIKMREFVI